VVVKKSISKGLYKCPHCDLVVDFPVDYCTICKGHCHTLFMGVDNKPPHPGICTHCYDGKSPMGREWRRQQKTWCPDRHFFASWDNPEWYDVMQEWKCSTLQEAWLCEEPYAEEL
jgi:hypothetical protein